MNNDKKSAFGNLDQQLEPIIKIVKNHLLIIFLVLLGLIYAYVLSKVNTYSNVQPTAEAVNVQVKQIPKPQISTALVNQLESLKDNSVNVQSLFDQSRQNPF